MSGGTPRKLNALPESRIPLIVSGANSPVSNTLPGQVAITSEKADNVAISRYSFGGYGRILWFAVALRRLGVQISLGLANGYGSINTPYTLLKSDVDVPMPRTI